MKSLDFGTMENVQGGIAGSISIGLPLTGLLSALGLGSLGATLQAGLGINFNLSIPELSTLPFGL